MNSKILIPLLIILTSCFSIFGQDSILNDSISVKDVVITRLESEVINLTKGREIDVQKFKVFGKATTLRKKAIAELKKIAASEGMNVILIVKDEFSNSPINNINIVGVTYRKRKD